MQLNDARREPALHILQKGEPAMITRMLISVTAATLLIAFPAVAQTTDKEQSGHHYQGGPKTEVPHHMGKKDTVGVSRQKASGGHHYTAGPSTSTPHHMGDKKAQ